MLSFAEKCSAVAHKPRVAISREVMLEYPVSLGENFENLNMNGFSKAARVYS